jgi:predicted RNase H-like nuclease (RuvC/YqgF family)
MDKRLLVAGVDPGTTIGFALLDLGGRIVVLESSKQLTFSGLIEKTVAKGRLVLVGCDKKKVPELVERYATKMGVRVIAPDHDLLILEKRQLVNAHTRNTHEFDAVACAEFALKEATPLLRRIRVFVKKNRKEHLFSEIASLVIREGVGIRLAADMIERPEREEVALARRAIAQETVPKERVVQLYEMLKKEKEQSSLLKRQNEKLGEELRKLRSLTDYLKKKLDRLVVEERAERLLRQRQEQIQGLDSQLRAMAGEIEELKNELAEERSLFSRLRGRVLVKKLRNLGSQEFERKRTFLNIVENDILLVDDPNVVSEAVLAELEKLQVALVVKKKMSDKVAKGLGIAVIQSDNLRLDESRYFAAVDSAALEQAKLDSGILQKLVKDYQARRK